MHTHAEVTEELLESLDFDVCLLATGAKPLVPPIPGLAESGAKLANEVLGGKYVIAGEKVLIIGGGLVGCECGEFLLQYENRVDLVDMITEFAEKPKEPKSNLASMGIYVFSWKTLRQYLTEDEANPESENDFGKNIIPTMLKDGQRMAAYRFAGYWKDVGTIDSLWDANMDMLSPASAGFDVYDTRVAHLRPDRRPAPPLYRGGSHPDPLHRHQRLRGLWHSGGLGALPLGDGGGGRPGAATPS